MRGKSVNNRPLCYPTWTKITHELPSELDVLRDESVLEPERREIIPSVRKKIVSEVPRLVDC